jgi:hypothetical protein
LTKNSSITDLNFNSSKQDFKVRRIQLLEPNSVVSKNQDIKNQFQLFSNGKIIDDIKKPISLSSNDKSKDDDVKKQISLPSNDKFKDDDIKKPVSLPSNNKSKDDNVKKSISLSSKNKSKDIKKPIQLSNKDNSRRKIKKKHNNAERKKKKIVKNYESLQSKVYTKSYTTRSNRISKPPSASSGGRWTAS